MGKHIKLTTKEQQILTEIGAEIQNKMLDKRMKLKDLAEKSGITTPVLNKIFSGKTYTISALVPVLVALDMDINIKNR